MKSMKKIVGNFILIVLLISMSIPFLYMIITSFKITYTAYNVDLSFSNLTLKNYLAIFKDTNIARFLFNSLFICICGTLLNLIFSSLAAFAFAKKRFLGNDQLFFYMIATLIVPSQVLLIPLYIIMRTLGGMDTYWALILPIPTAFGVFLLRQAILNLPEELVEAAKIDGCSDFRIFIQILLPLLQSPMIALAIFTFTGAWNEFLWPLIMTTNDSVRTVTVGMSILQSQYTVNYGWVMAGATITFLPSFLFYLLLQSKFVEGVTLSGSKG